MSSYIYKVFSVLFVGTAVLAACSMADTSAKTKDKQPNGEVTTSSQPSAAATPAAKIKGEQTAVFAGGCFWGLEAVFEHIKGVSDVTSGYSGGDAKTADYETVSTGETGHAESVKITYDPSQVTYEQLLKVFFAVAHDPTELNRQGPDTGTQYRSSIFYTNDEQKRLAESYIADLTAAKTFPQPIVTKVVALDKFYPAEDYHQNYLAQHPNQPYIVVNDKPKVENLNKLFPDLYVAK